MFFSFVYFLCLFFVFVSICFVIDIHINKISPFEQKERLLLSHCWSSSTWLFCRLVWLFFVDFLCVNFNCFSFVFFAVLHDYPASGAWFTPVCFLLTLYWFCLMLVVVIFCQHCSVSMTKYWFWEYCSSCVHCTCFM